MSSIQIEILNPKANNLLKDLADQKLISIKKNSPNDNFLKIVRRIRNKAKADTPHLWRSQKKLNPQELNDMPK